MQQKRSRNPKSKLFQCTGYANCNMVFTRSEHLARHSRKHTGEKPFKCIVPECNKAFSRYDNMMQHTQTHRNHNYQVISNAAKEYYRKEKSRSTRTQTSKNNNKEIKETVPKELISSSGLYPSVSSSSSSSSSFSDEEELINTQISPVKKQKRDHWHQRRLSIADLCNPPISPSSSSSDTVKSGVLNLTKDEFEALEGFRRFRHLSSSFYFASLKCLTSREY